MLVFNSPYYTQTHTQSLLIIRFGVCRRRQRLVPKHWWDLSSTGKKKNYLNARLFMIGSYREEKGKELTLVLVFKCGYHCSCCCHLHCNHFDKNNDMNHQCYDNLRADDSCGMRYRNTRLYLCDNKYFLLSAYNNNNNNNNNNNIIMKVY